MGSEALLMLLAMLAAGATVIGQSEPLHSVLPPDGIPSIDQPTFELVAANRWYADDELMIGIVGNQEQRAYSTWTLDVHEIVNDVFEGQPIAVTW